MPTIMVLSDPKSGQGTGDWIVKKQSGLIISRHRLKSSAVRKAKQIARRESGEVRIQNTKGQFKQGPSYM